MRPELREIYDRIRNTEIPDAVPLAKSIQQVLRNHPGDIGPEAQEALIAELVNLLMMLEMRVIALEMGVGGTDESR